MESLPFHFVMIPHMKVLSVKSMKFPQIKTNAFKGVNVDIIYATDYYLCCIVTSTSQCSAVIPWYFSCSDLLPNKCKTIFITLIMTL